MEDSVNAYDRLIEELCQPVYVADSDTYDILYMNKACREIFTAVTIWVRDAMRQFRVLMLRVISEQMPS